MKVTNKVHKMDMKMATKKHEDNIEKAKNESSEIIDKANKIMLEANNQVASYIKIIKKYFSYGNIYCGKGAKKKF